MILRFYLINDFGHSGSSIITKKHACDPTVASNAPTAANIFATLAIFYNLLLTSIDKCHATFTS